MKNIFINNPKITRDEISSQKMFQYLKNKFEKNSALFVEGAEVFSDMSHLKEDIEQEKDLNVLIQYSAFIGDYLNLILFENDIAEKKKPSPYSIFSHLTIDFKFSKAKLYFYIDESIFGLIAGSGYSNIVNLIRTSFPIFNKIGADVEVKFFSLSDKYNREGFSEFSED